MMTKPTVFLSHSSKDSSVLCALKQKLEQHTSGTIDFFLSSDGESIPFGRNWVGVIQDALERTKICFVFLTPNSTGSSWIYFESGYIYSKHIRVVPVALPGVDLGKVPPPLGLLQGFNIHSHESLNNLFRILNDEFGTSFPGKFTADDFSELISPISSGVESYFKDWTEHIDRLSIVASPKQQVAAKFQELLQSKQIEFSSKSFNDHASRQVLRINTYGVELDELPQGKTPHLRIDISPDVRVTMLSLLDELLASVELEAPFELTLRFSQGLNLLSPHFKVTSRFQNSPVTLQKEGGYAYQNIEFSLRAERARQSSNRFYSSACGPEIVAKFKGNLSDARLFNLVELFIKRGVVFQQNVSLEDFI